MSHLRVLIYLRRQSYTNRWFVTGLSLEEAICHEMGHTLSLGHSSRRDSIMYASIGFRYGDVKLGADDIKGIQKLYGPPNGKVFIPIHSSSLSLTTTRLP